jgi:hypothetical protein
MSVPLDAFYAACPGVVLVRDMDAALAALPADASVAAIRAAILPLMPEGNPLEYMPGAPPAIGTPMPGGSPVLQTALPAYPAGLPRFQDSNPDPLDGWSIDRSDPAGPW